RAPVGTSVPRSSLSNGPDLTRGRASTGSAGSTRGGAGSPPVVCRRAGSVGSGPFSVRRCGGCQRRVAGLPVPAPRERASGGRSGHAGPGGAVRLSPDTMLRIGRGLGAIAGCGRVGDHERQGDQLYGEGQYSQALAEYRTALVSDPDPRLWAKTGAAALRTGNLEVASNSYLRLAAEDPTRSEEAAEG